MGVYQIYPKKKKNLFPNLSVTVSLILINVVLFILVRVLLSIEIISENFFMSDIAISLENIKQLRLWTFLTSMFMHGGFFHLFANMFSLMFIGGLIERILGKKRYLWFYLISGLFAGVLYILIEFLSPSNLPAVGASGALFGLVGLLVLLTPNLPVYVMFIPIPIKMKYAGPGILIVLWIISRAANIGIGNTAHLGGLVCGLAYGMYLKTKYKNKTKWLSRHFS
ncbi:rhomboid family intramembrane serine protease [Candidatus Pacearchaeota archaeon]|nr:rhomboid family intramembrane serine protease [Candidatus Pacearchaeota archaeon]